MTQPETPDAWLDRVRDAALEAAIEVLERRYFAEYRFTDGDRVVVGLCGERVQVSLKLEIV